MRIFSNKQKADYTKTLQKGISYVRGLRGGLTDDTGSREENILRLKDELGRADAIVIGAGAGLSTAAGFTYSGERFDRYFFDFKERFGIRDMYSGGFYPFQDEETRWAWWARHIYFNRYIDAPKPVYQDLLSLVIDKDYFVITTNVDHQFQGAGPFRLLHVFARTVRTNVRTFVTIMCVLATAKIMSYSGMTSDMAAFLVTVTGSYYPLIPPLIGTLGGFVTGSGTSTCVLFGPMQVQTAKAIGADPAWLVAANTCGAGIGKMISPQGIAIGAASAGLSGSESRLMASVMKYCILVVVVAGVLSYFLQ